MIGPGNATGSIRVISDILCLRAFGGQEAWKVAQNQTPEGYAQPGPGKSAEVIKREEMVLEVCLKTRLILRYAEDCLASNEWNIEKAFAAFQQMKVSLKCMFQPIKTMANIRHQLHRMPIKSLVKHFGNWAMGRRVIFPFTWT